MPLKSLAEYQVTAMQKYHVVNTGYQGITLLYVLKGSVNVTCNEYCQTLQKNDILLINRDTPYQLDSLHANIVLNLEIADAYCVRYYKNYFFSHYILGEMETPDIKKHYVDNIRRLLANIMISYLKESQQSLLEINHSLSHLLLILVSFFREPTSKIDHKALTYSDKIKNAIRFIEDNYNKQISLQQVAQHEYISISYLSRLFKKEVGIGFIEYLNNIKFERATHDLIHTKSPIYRIAEKHGFFDVKQFTKMFKLQYQTTPKKYRIEYQSNQADIIFTPINHYRKEPQQTESPVAVAELLPLLVNIINTQDLISNEYSSYDEQLIDLTQSTIDDTIPSTPYIIFVGELQELLKENVKQQIALLKETTHINYVEVSHLISGNTILPEFITDEPTPTHSPYYNSDIAIAFLHKHNIALFVRIYHKSFKMFNDIYMNKIIKFLQNYVNHYGLDYVQRWQFIYYIDESEFNAKTAHEFFNSFVQIRQAIQSCIPQCKVGLYCPIINHEGEVESYGAKDLLQQADFLGYASTPDPLSEETSQTVTPDNRVMCLQRKAQKLRTFLKRNDINVPLYLMKWNTFTGNTRHTNGSYFRGALIFQTLLALFQYVNGIGIVLNTEMQQEENKPNHIDTSRIALFYLFNTKRPIFYVLKFLDKLKGRIIARSADYLITENPYGYQMILTNVSVFNPHISIQAHLIQSFQQQRLVSLMGIKPGNYQIKKYTFDQQNGAVYRQYLYFSTKFGYDQEIIEYINRNTVPELAVHDENIKDKWEVLTKLDINAIHFYELKRVE